MDSKFIYPSRTHYFVCFLLKFVNLGKNSELIADIRGDSKLMSFENVDFALQEALCVSIFAYVLGIKCRVSGHILVFQKH